MNSRKTLLILGFIFFAAILIRFYNFDHRVTFWSEQARSLIVSADYLTKPSLLGQDYFVRHDSFGRVLFAGAFFNYLLVPVVYLTKNTLLITSLFSLLNLVTGLVVYFVSRKIFGLKVALFATVIFLFNDMMIYHSLFIWIYNFLPLLGILSLYELFLYYKKPKSMYALVLGLLSGFGFSTQILYFPTAILVLAILLWKKTKLRFQSLIFYILGMIFINLPMIIFDFRHNFYYLQTFTLYFLDTIKGTSNAQIVYYHFLQFWPLFAILLAFIVVVIYQKNRPAAIIFVTIYLLCNIFSSKVNYFKPTGTPGGLYVSELDRASQMIAQDVNGPFNVASLLDFDKQAFTLRYFVQYKYDKKSLGVEEYPNSPELYVLSQKDYNFKESNVWEISSGGPYNVVEFVPINSNYSIYKLTK